MPGWLQALAAFAELGGGIAWMLGLATPLEAEPAAPEPPVPEALPSVLSEERETSSRGTAHAGAVDGRRCAPVAARGREPRAGPFV